MRPSFIKKQLYFILSRYFVIIIVAVFLAILSIGYLLFIQEKVVEIQEIGVVDLKSRENKLASRQETLARLKRLDERYRSITTDQLKQLDNVLPPESEIPYLVLEIKSFVKDNDLILRDIDVGSLGTGPISSPETSLESGEAGTPLGIDIKKLPITLSLSGLDSYAKLKIFLDNLSLNLPLLELNSLSYSPATDAYNLNLTTYYR